jgi:mono/diheme cytochrome c family protein
VKRPTVIACALLTALAAGCGGEIEVSGQEASARDGAQLFYERCSGCHSLEAANSYGSKVAGQIKTGERTNGPNFNVRKERRDDVLYAIRNGGFSGAIMPANIVTGEDAEKVADFVARYSGSSEPGGGDDVMDSGESGG